MKNWLILGALIFCSAWAGHGQTLLGSRDAVVHDIAVMDSLLGAATNNRVELWNLKTKQLIGAMNYDGADKFSSVCFGTGPDELITGTRQGVVTRWILGVKEQRIITGAGTGAITSLDTNPARNLLAVGSSDHQLTVIDLATHRVLFRDSSYSSDVTAVRFSRDGRGLMVTSGSGKVIYYSLDDFKTSVMAELATWIFAVSERCDSAEVAFATDHARLFFLPMLAAASKRAGSFLRTSNEPVTSLDHYPGDCLVYATMSGRIVIGTSVGFYHAKLSTVVSQVRFVPSPGKYLQVAVATKGKGIIMLDARKMRLQSAKTREYLP